MNKKIIIAIVALVAVIGIFLGIFFLTRPETQQGAKEITVIVVHNDGTEKTFPLERKGEPQEIDLGEHIIEWIRLDKLIKSDDPSAFPALSVIEVYGTPVEA